MDPITPALLAAIVAAAKEKAVGAAVELVAEAAKVAAKKLHGLLPDGNEAKQARALVEHVLAEMAAFPPERAIVVKALATSGTVGIWAPCVEISRLHSTQGTSAMKQSYPVCVGYGGSHPGVRSPRHR